MTSTDSAQQSAAQAPAKAPAKDPWDLPDVSGLVVGLPRAIQTLLWEPC